MPTKQALSDSRTYVAICNKGNFKGHYFFKFTLPTTINDVPAHAKNFLACQTENIRNDSEYASWYFLNVLDSYACIDGCFTFEDFQNIEEVV